MSTRTIKEYTKRNGTRKRKVGYDEVLTREKKARIKAIMVLQRRAQETHDYSMFRTVQYRDELMALQSILISKQGGDYVRKVAAAYCAWREV